MSTIKTVKVGRYLIFPKIQLKYALIFSGLVVFYMATLLWGVDYFMQGNLELSGDTSGLEESRISVLRYGGLMIGLSFVLNFLVTILVTHRFLGPIVGIKIKLDSFLVSKEIKEIKIRKTDEVHELVKSLNSFLEKWDRGDSKE